ncbi:MAG: beta-ketoacyl-[acyl-carrier-protein] synthase II [Alphaproteobacteria bacterium RIFCSPHIGHO2_02_FULL_40_34]|nr:MAG: beta-ketoacyl-[acyl-carrier-protein] synthase II [Alphaproteobacteria bacterium RIFCSPHIGHO2_02_FULL_40_34]
MTNKRRVVITGIGAVTPLSANAEGTWNKLINAESGIGKITLFDASECPCKIAGEVKHGDGEHLFNPDKYIDPKEQRKMDRFIHFAVAAADQAIADSGWKAESEEQKYRTGVMIGSGIGGLPAIEKTVLHMKEKGVKKISPFFIPQSLINLAAGQVSIKHGFMGPNHAIVTACATGSHAIGDSARMIEYSDVDIMIAGGAECAICESGIGGFSALRALSTNFNDNPQAGSRPWDKDRDGFVMGEGAGILVLEEYEHAKKRGAKIYAEIIGYGMSGDAYHMTAPESSGRGSTHAMKVALKHAGLNPENIDYINAHGTSTPLGDEIEVASVKKVFGDHAYKLSMSSTKSAIGHLLGAAGAVEAIFSILAIRDNVAPPTLNLDSPSENCDIDLVAKQAKQRKIDIAMSNSFGFGGTNACLILKRI